MPNWSEIFTIEKLLILLIFCIILFIPFESIDKMYNCLKVVKESSNDHIQGVLKTMNKDVVPTKK